MKCKRAFNLKILGVCRNIPDESARCAEIDEYFTINDLRKCLTRSEFVVSVVPRTTSTDGIFDYDILQYCDATKVVQFIRIINRCV